MKNGFTLIEIFIIVSIIGLVSSIAIPLVGNLYKKNKLKKIGNTIVFSKEETNAEAIKKYEVKMLFEIDGVKVYQFRNEHLAVHYFFAAKDTNNCIIMEKGD